MTRIAIIMLIAVSLITGCGTNADGSKLKSGKEVTKTETSEKKAPN